MSNKVTKTETLLREIKRRGKKGMTRKQMVDFLLRNDGGYDVAIDAKGGTYNSLIYGTRTRTGLVDGWLKKTANGSYVLRKKNIKGPFTKAKPSPYVEFGGSF